MLSNRSVRNLLWLYLTASVSVLLFGVPEFPTVRQPRQSAAPEKPDPPLTRLQSPVDYVMVNRIQQPYSCSFLLSDQEYQDKFAGQELEVLGKFCGCLTADVTQTAFGPQVGVKLFLPFERTQKLVHVTVGTKSVSSESTLLVRCERTIEVYPKFYTEPVRWPILEFGEHETTQPFRFTAFCASSSQQEDMSLTLEHVPYGLKVASQKFDCLQEGNIQLGQLSIDLVVDANVESPSTGTQIQKDVIRFRCGTETFPKPIFWRTSTGPTKDSRSPRGRSETQTRVTADTAISS